MKGIVFTEFLEMVDAVFSPEVSEAIIAECDLASNGAYTAVGTYDDGEILALVTALSKHTNVPVPALVKAFGKHLFQTFVRVHPDYFEAVDNTFDFLESVDGHIHVEVRKLDRDATVPSLSCSRPEDATLVVDYRSERPLADLADGLIEASIEHFGDSISVERTNHDDTMQRASFVLRHA